jgi:hypothetical protein
MSKPKLNLTRPKYESKEVTVDAATTASINKHVSEIMGAVSHVTRLIKEEKVDTAHIQTVLELSQSLLLEIANEFKLPCPGQERLQSAREAIKYHSSMVKYLKVEMAKGVTTEAICTKLSEMKEFIYDWWKNEGFLTAEITVIPYHDGASFACNLSTYIDKHGSSERTSSYFKKKDKKEIVDSIKENFDLKSNDSDLYILDTDKNKKVFANKFTTMFPGSSINEIKVMHVGELVIREIKVRIPASSIVISQTATE